MEGQEMNRREANMLRSVMSFYETRQYSHCLEICEKILAKYPNNGETLSIKGLCLYHTGRRDEAQDLVKRGVRCNVTSYMTWYCYGIYNKMCRSYKETSKCYRNALRCKPGNLMIMCDLAIVLTETRDYSHVVEVRKKILERDPGMRENWVGLIIALYLSGQKDDSVRTLDFLLENITSGRLSISRLSDSEHTELLSFKILVLYEMGRFKELVECIEKNRCSLGDRVFVGEMEGDCYYQTGEYEKAEIVYRSLLEENSYNSLYLDRLISIWKKRKAEELLDNVYTLYNKIPSSTNIIHSVIRVFRDIPERFVELQQFVKQYLTKMIQKKIPSIFNQMCNIFYDTEEGVNMVLSLIAELEVEYGNNSRWLAWINYYMARHYDYLKQYRMAMEYVNKGKCLDPSLDFFLLESEICRKNGDFRKAISVLEENAGEDISEKFVACEIMRMYLWENRLESSLKLFYPFTTEKNHRMSLMNSVNDQNLLYEEELANYFERNMMFGTALKILYQMKLHFDEFHDDKFDFHNYVLRKMTIRSYVDLLKFDSHLHRNPTYLRVVGAIISLHMKLYHIKKRGLCPSMVNIQQNMEKIKNEESLFVFAYEATDFTSMGKDPKEYAEMDDMEEANRLVTSFHGSLLVGDSDNDMCGIISSIIDFYNIREDRTMSIRYLTRLLGIVGAYHHIFIEKLVEFCMKFDVVPSDVSLELGDIHEMLSSASRDTTDISSILGIMKSMKMLGCEPESVFRVFDDFLDRVSHMIEGGNGTKVFVEFQCIVKGLQLVCSMHGCSSSSKAESLSDKILTIYPFARINYSLSLLAPAK